MPDVVGKIAGLSETCGLPLSTFVITGLPGGAEICARCFAKSNPNEPSPEFTPGGRYECVANLFFTREFADPDLGPSNLERIFVLAAQVFGQSPELGCPLTAAGAAFFAAHAKTFWANSDPSCVGSDCDVDNLLHQWLATLAVNSDDAAVAAEARTHMRNVAAERGLEQIEVYDDQDSDA
jgi:hypothetical protein